METRSKKKNKSGETSPPSTPSVDSNSTTDCRSWSDLPHDLLLPIFIHLSLSIPDLLCFAAVCRSWRSTASAAVAVAVDSLPFCRPPLLLSPLLSRRGRRPKWSGPPQCRLRTLTLGKTYRSMISSKTLRNRCIGCSYGHLVFDAGERVLLVDVFTGDKIPSPQLPKPFRRFQIGILTAKPSSEPCVLICVGSGGSMFWRLDSNAWAEEPYLRYGDEVISLALFNGLIYCLDESYRVKVVNFDLPASWRTLELQLPQYSVFREKFGRYLIECGGELLLVLFVRLEQHWCRIDVYQLDLLKVKWVRKEDLGDWCLFVDVVGNCPMACPNPESWGGRRNCIYVACSGYDGWSVFPLDGSEIDLTDVKNALSSSHKDLPRWPSPVWVYPSKLL